MIKDPAHLYKYRCVSPLSLRMLKEGKYFFASAHSFNDPLDCSVEPIYELPHIDKIVENQAKVLHDNEGISFEEALHKSQKIRSVPKAELDKLLQRIKGSIQQMLKNEYGVLSLSAKNDNVLMWSHYSDYHKGFCIQFNRSSVNLLGVTQSVKYVKEYPCFNYFDDLPGNIVKKRFIRLKRTWTHGVRKFST